MGTPYKLLTLKDLKVGDNVLVPKYPNVFCIVTGVCCPPEQESKYDFKICVNLGDNPLEPVTSTDVILFKEDAVYLGKYYYDLLQEAFKSKRK